MIALPEAVSSPEFAVDRIMQMAGGVGAALVGLNFPIGLPRSYGALTGFNDFRHAIRTFGVGEWENWFSVCKSADEISIYRPFYPAFPKGRYWEDLTERLDITGSGELLRRCDREIGTRGWRRSIFWTAGPHQVGKTVIAGWKGILSPCLENCALWPFDGEFSTLVSCRGLVFAEIFPSILYDRVGFPPRYAWSGKTLNARVSVAGTLLKFLHKNRLQSCKGLRELVLNGFSENITSSGAQFESLVGLLSIFSTLDDFSDHSFLLDPEVKRWEGWMWGLKSPIVGV